MSALIPLFSLNNNTNSKVEKWNAAFKIMMGVSLGANHSFYEEG
jgi:hypothetical protein